MTSDLVYPTAYASVRFFAENLDPFDVTERLRLPPDEIHRRGEPRLKRTKSGRVAEYSPYTAGMWTMSSEQWVNSPELAVHIAWVISELETRASVVQELIASGVEGDIFCYSVGQTEEPPTLQASLHERAGALGLAIDIDHYVE